VWNSRNNVFIWNFWSFLPKTEIFLSLFGSTSHKRMDSGF
jgi:hypothetical protein